MTQIQISTLGTHVRASITSAKPFVSRDIRPGAAFAISCDAQATATVELTLSPSSEPSPLYVRASIGSDGIVAAGESAIEEIRCKLAGVRVTVAGAGTATVEVLQ